ncbi:MAG: type II toxin-antitoxin system RelE/ParE family toxin [Magnetovibrio sp.]|nr:type II toxin-antitoxin system RelE/ParE family toxin [Magnetovibrio sp.]
MTYIVRLREEAELDLSEAASWYELQRSGLGDEFLEAVLFTLNLIGENPQVYPVVHRETHRAVVSRFPFVIFYLVVDTEVTVLSVMHGSRHPSRWKTRA